MLPAAKKIGAFAAVTCNMKIEVARCRGSTLPGWWSRIIYLEEVGGGRGVSVTDSHSLLWKTESFPPQRAESVLSKGHSLTWIYCPNPGKGQGHRNSLLAGRTGSGLGYFWEIYKKDTALMVWRRQGIDRAEEQCLH